MNYENKIYSFYDNHMDSLFPNINYHLEFLTDYLSNTEYLGNLLCSMLLRISFKNRKDGLKRENPHFQKFITKLRIARINRSPPNALFAGSRLHFVQVSNKDGRIDYGDYLREDEKNHRIQSLLYAQTIS